MRNVILAVAAILIAASACAAAEDNLAATPPMGWNSWNLFACKVDDKTVRAAADAMVSSGMKDAGYIYVNIDDCWQGKRDAAGNLQPNERFPDMKALAGYVHGKGLKIGIYSSPGPKTCAGYEGSYKHEVQDANQYAKWGFDYLKYDWCSAEEVYKHSEMPAVYAKMGEALKKTGRPILYSLCQYGVDAVWKWGVNVGGNAWRTTDDIEPTFQSIVFIGFSQHGLDRYAGPGHWNDPDMLEVGNGKLTPEENRFHMSLWCLLAAPLLAGNDLSSMKPEVKEILANSELIALDQDPLGKEAHRVWQEGPVQIWVRPLAGGSMAVGLFNQGESKLPASIDLKTLGFDEKAEVTVRDLWAKKDLDKVTGRFSTTIPSHGVVLVKMK